MFSVYVQRSATRHGQQLRHGGCCLKQVFEIVQQEQHRCAQ